jgi:hypothetical protein
MAQDGEDFWKSIDQAQARSFIYLVTAPEGRLATRKSKRAHRFE